MTAYTYRMPAGIAGAVSRPHHLTAEPVALNNAKAFDAYGLAGKDVGGYFVPLEAGDAVGVILGFYIRPYPTTSTPDLVRQVGTDKNLTGDRLRRGYMTVNVGVDASGITPRAPVNIRIANPSATSPLGAPVAAAVADETVVLPTAFFTGPGDAAGNVEIEYNI